jgi:DNA-binding response OmpR family regulator
MLLNKKSCIVSGYGDLFSPYLKARAEVDRGHCMALDFLSRKLVLLVEDEPLIALDIENHLRKSGARVVAAATLDAAWSIAHHPHLSAAIVDLCLGAQSAIPICRYLADRNVPFVVHTGYEPDTIEREWPATPIMRKPVNPVDVVHALAGVVQQVHVPAKVPPGPPLNRTP